MADRFAAPGLSEPEFVYAYNVPGMPTRGASGQIRPAIHVGLSVSRVGSAAQLSYRLTRILI